MDAHPKDFVIHDIGFEEGDWGVVEAIGEEISGPDEGVIAGANGVRIWVRVGGELGGVGEGSGEGSGEGKFFGEGLAEEFGEHGEALVIEAQFGSGVATIDEEVEMISGDKFWLEGIAPGLGVEV